MTSSDEWMVREEPGWSLRFRHPPTDGDGRPVIVDRRDLPPDMARVHVMADDRDEIYFEVVRAPGVPATEFHRSMQERLPERYPDISFAPLEESGVWLCGSFTWADQVRIVCFTERADSTYRVIYRPGSTINRAIWGTVEVV